MPPTRSDETTRAESSRFLLRVGAKPITWVNDDTGSIEIHSTATPDEIRDALDLAMVRMRDAGHGRTPFIETARAHALEVDPYAFEGHTFGDVVAFERARNVGEWFGIVRHGILLDVEHAHSLLDSLKIPGGMLTTRIGYALINAGLPPAIGDDCPAAKVLDNRDRYTRGREKGPDPIPEGVRIPDAVGTLERLFKMPAEAAFKIFDSLKLLPPNADEIRGWALTDRDDVTAMIERCCRIAFDSERLGELAKAVDEYDARAGK